MNRRIAFVTYRERPEVTADDALAKAVLAGHGVDVEGIPWDADQTDWRSFEAVVLRSCWDYFHRPSQFLSWIAELERKGVNLLNGPAVVRWNSDKTYLNDLMKAGVNVIPTVYVSRNSGISIAAVFREQGWERAVIKPTISGTSLHTWVCSAESLENDQCKLDLRLQERNMMLQEYFPEVETEGELSLIYFEGQFSHAVRKVPHPGDFRVQNDFGGTSRAITPGPEILGQAQDILRAGASDFVYARVDGIMRRGMFVLMELEMIEPHLFLESDPGAPARFAHVIENRVRRRVGTESKTKL